MKDKETKPEGKSFWSDVKWFFVEIMNIYSTKNSYFSKKRIESGIGFIIAEWGMIYFLLSKIDGMSASDFAIWASIQFIVAGYVINHIQKEKKKNDSESDSEKLNS